MEAVEAMDAKRRAKADIDRGVCSSLAIGEVVVVIK